MTAMRHRFTVPIAPVAKQRPRLGRRRKAFTPPATVAFERAVRAACEGGPWFDGPVKVECVFHRDKVDVTVTSLSDTLRPVAVRGDLDNYVKSILDGMQPHAHDDEHTGIISDDKLVHHLVARFGGRKTK